MPERHLHIVSFDIPYPANYGGVIDVFFKAKALAEHGVKVHLHCFEYNRGHAPVLEELFHSVHYYKRDISKKQLFKSIPYIVSSRNSEELVDNLLKDDYPILMEGLHTSALLSEPRLKGRKRVVRTHNIEHEYYHNLARVENDLFKKYYFYNEAAKLKRYEEVLQEADLLLAISHHDKEYFSAQFSKVEFVPAFHPFKSVESRTGRGKYVLYHGNLSVPENSNAAKFLVNNVFDDLDVPLKVAGLNPPRHLSHLFNNGRQNIELIPNPDDGTLNELIRNAHVNILITAQKTGLKLKLLNTLYNGRFCVVNEKMLSGSNLDDLCIIANDQGSMKRKINKLFEEEFGEKDILERREVLGKAYNNGQNVEKLIDLVC